MIEVKLEGLDALMKRLDAMGAELRGPVLGAALKAAALPVLNAAKEKAPYKTGNLRRSLHVGEPRVSGGEASITVGTNVPYARRLEYGFVGTDKRGRRYNQPARPYLRPAFDENKDAAQAEAAAVIRAALERAA